MFAEIPHDNALASALLWAIFGIGLLHVFQFFLTELGKFLRFLAEWILHVGQLVNPNVNKQTNDQLPSGEASSE